MEIRGATEADAAAIQAIYGPIVRETAISFELEEPTVEEMARRIRTTLDQGYPYLVAREGEQVVGYAYAGAFRTRAAYQCTAETTVYVQSGLRGKGVGRALMVELISQLRAQGRHSLIAGVTLPNDGSVRLHESLGFRPVARFAEVGHKLGAHHDVGFWQLMLRAVVLMLALVVAPRAADACSCASPATGILWPRGPYVAPNDRILIRTRSGEMPALEALYSDGGGSVRGRFDQLGDNGFALWAFLPSRPLEAGRKVLLRSPGVRGTETLEVEVLGEPDTTPPEMRGATSVTAFETRYTPDSVPTSCDDSARGGAFDRIERIESGLGDRGAPGLIQRLFVYPTPGARPTEPANVGMEGWVFRSTYCAGTPCGQPALAVDFAPGDTVCVRIEWEDAAGNRSGYEDEACTQVEPQLFWLDGFAGCKAPPAVDSGFSTPDVDLDGGITANMDASAGNGFGGGRGCTCTVAPRSAGGGWMFVAMMLVYGRCAVRRSRAVRRRAQGA